MESDRPAFFSSYRFYCLYVKLYKQGPPFYDAVRTEQGQNTPTVLLRPIVHTQICAVYSLAVSNESKYMVLTRLTNKLPSMLQGKVKAGKGRTLGCETNVLDQILKMTSSAASVGENPWANGFATYHDITSSFSLPLGLVAC